MGLDATGAIAAVDVVGQYVFGTTLAYVNQLAEEGKPSEVPEVGGGSMTPSSSPTWRERSGSPSTSAGTGCSIAAYACSCEASSSSGSVVRHHLGRVPRSEGFVELEAVEPAPPEV